MQARPTGFTVLETLVASALLAFGLAGAMRVSSTSLAAMQLNRHMDVASGLAQDLAECWEVQTPFCMSLFQQSAWLFPISTDPTLGFARTWQVQDIPIPNMPPQHLQEIRIAVTWQEAGQVTKIEWLARHASTPLWAGR
jgi:hypothetical protein